ncbi:nuclear transport factor 2 family protein [Amnibacterium sp. CER49]|uniref:nuclear transport factor 2 family protein n=1 Tax=Amnibacterium sp. CER49 TaxID=3039161 RepID=UPI002447F4AB|nr:nuclear transport factor 2 family protein [Amnibacterium sp. CER49]MDH2443773.1 nuclear transport factor 2 family protein [Amnibacterium sp. CER49]
MTTTEQQGGSEVPRVDARSAPDRDEIVRVVQQYVAGFGGHDTGLFRRAFHPTARIFFTWPDGRLFENLIAEEFEGWAASDVTASGRVLSLTQAGDVATVLLAFDQTDSNNWVDAHSLLRLGGEWKIMNKTATHATRAGWAGVPARRQGDEPQGAEPRFGLGAAPDRDAIARVVHLYTDGMGADDEAMFREAFHPHARISYTNAEGELHEGPMTEGYEPWAHWPTPISGRIVALTQAGDLATVVLGFDAPGGPEDSWLDVHSLLRIDGIWQIVNKTATHATRGDWAGKRLA